GALLGASLGPGALGAVGTAGARALHLRCGGLARDLLRFRGGLTVLAARLLRLLGRLLCGLGGLALGAAALHLLHRGAVVVAAELPGPPAEGHPHQPRGALAHRAALLDLVEAADALGQREGQIAGVGRVGIVAVPALTADEALARLPRLDDPQHVGRAV